MGFNTISRGGLTNSNLMNISMGYLDQNLWIKAQQLTEIPPTVYA